MKAQLNNTTNTGVASGHASNSGFHSMPVLLNHRRIINFTVKGQQNIASIHNLIKTFCPANSHIPPDVSELNCTLTIESDKSLDSGLNHIVKLPSLTSRECEVLKMVAQGSTNKKIADQLNLTYNTVRNHLKNIYFKLGVRNKTEASLVWFGHENEIPLVRH